MAKIKPKKIKNWQNPTMGKSPNISDWLKQEKRKKLALPVSEEDFTELKTGFIATKIAEKVHGKFRELQKESLLSYYMGGATLQDMTKKEEDEKSFDEKMRKWEDAFMENWGNRMLDDYMRYAKKKKRILVPKKMNAEPSFAKLIHFAIAEQIYYLALALRAYKDYKSDEGIETLDDVADVSQPYLGIESPTSFALIDSIRNLYQEIFDKAGHSFQSLPEKEILTSPVALAKWIVGEQDDFAMEKLIHQAEYCAMLSIERKRTLLNENMFTEKADLNCKNSTELLMFYGEVLVNGIRIALQATASGQIERLTQTTVKVFDAQREMFDNAYYEGVKDGEGKVSEEKEAEINRLSKDNESQEQEIRKLTKEAEESKKEIEELQDRIRAMEEIEDAVAEESETEQTIDPNLRYVICCMDSHFMKFIPSLRQYMPNLSVATKLDQIDTNNTDMVLIFTQRISHGFYWGIKKKCSSAGVKYLHISNKNEEQILATISKWAGKKQEKGEQS